MNCFIYHKICLSNPFKSCVIFIFSLHSQIMDIGKSKLSGQQAKLDSVNKIIDEVTQKKTKASVGIKTAARYTNIS